MDSALRALSALAKDSRLAVFRLLVESLPDGLPAGEVAARLELAPATLSFHLSRLERAGLLTSHRRGRWIIYAADFARMQSLMDFLTENCCGGDPAACAAPPGAERPARAASGLGATPSRRPRPGNPTMAADDKVYNVLFLCTGNSARSIMAEAILNAIGRDRFRAFSAGSHPKEKIHPLALELLRRERLPTEGLRSKNWEELAKPGAPELDFVFTLCDQAAGEACPAWPGRPITAHWGSPDPVAFDGSEGEKLLFFARVYREIASRLAIFTGLPVVSLDRLSLKARLDEIGQTQPQEA